MEWTIRTNMQRLQPTPPYSSDEGAESGEDSEEDLVTNFLSTSPPKPTMGEVLPHRRGVRNEENRTTAGGAPPNAPRRLVRMAELPTMDSVTAENLGMGTNATPIPTISITPHSPITQKPFLVLDESLRHLRWMQEKILQMREIRSASKDGRALSRLSSSCPSLNVEGEDLEEDDLPSCKSAGSSIGCPHHRGSLGGWGDTTPSPTTPITSGSLDDSHLCPDTPKIRVNDSTPTGSEEFLLDIRKPRGPCTLEQARRRSWSGLSDEEKKRVRQRSVSVSSLDSDTEEPYYDHPPRGARGSDGLDGRPNDKGGSFPVDYKGGRSSTHSLNESHLDDENKAASEKPRLLAPRLTLQKSVSTPSILAGIINQQTQKQPTTLDIENADPYYSVRHEGPPTTDVGAIPHHMLLSHNVLPKKLLNYQYDDEVSSKPRKRGSIFFRKKKEKPKKTSHQFVSVCYSTSATCDVCGKPMANKAALRCESCLSCVHEHSCKDQISDCAKLRSIKLMQKRPSSVGTGIGTLGSSGIVYPRGAPGSRSKSFAGTSASPTRPYASGAPPGSSPVRRLSGLSQWRRVATKLGVNKGMTEEKDVQDLHADIPDANILEINSASMESLDDVPETTESTLDYIDSDPELRLLELEPELWVKTVDKEVTDRITERQVKKQEYIYELIMTEKNHCRTLKLIKKLFAEAMVRELSLGEKFVENVFPRLDELINIHFNFLWRLRERQRMGRYIVGIGDLLLDQFSGENAQSLKEAYGEICSKQPDSIATYKDLQKTDRRFQSFIKAKSSHGLLEKKEVMERWVFTSQRCTKYPLGITEMIKYTVNDHEEQEMLVRALCCIKDILRDINAQVHQKEMGQRLLEIYHKIDAKSSSVYKDHKFKKSDILADERRLMFEGTAVLNHQRGKQLAVVLIVMTDLIFFLQENNQKYYFVAPDNKMGVIPLAKLIVREDAGQEKIVYLILSANQAEMYELECIHPNSRRTWLESIKDAIERCPHDDIGLRKSEGKMDRIHDLIMALQQYDKDLAKLCEKKSEIVYQVVSSLGFESSAFLAPDYRALLDQNYLDHEAAKELQISSLTEALRLVSSAYGWGTNLARSVSSVGEHQSEAYVSPSLPKRAETFGGFDNPIKDNHTSVKSSGGKRRKDSKVPCDTPTNGDQGEGLQSRRPSAASPTVKTSQDNLSVTSHESEGSGSDQVQHQVLAAHLVRCLSTALILSQHHLSQYEILRAKLSTGATFEGRFSHSQKLEELRNLQEQISHERAQWMRERDNQEKWIVDKKEELNRLKESLRRQQEDICQQREDLYRKLEALKNQGILLNPNLNVITSSGVHHQDSGAVLVSETMSQTSPHTSPPIGISHRHKGGRSDPPDPPRHRNSTACLISAKRDSNPSLPTHLISAANQQKAPMAVKQQLPMKLAKLGTAGGGNLTSYPSNSSGVSYTSSLTSPPPPSGIQQMLPMKLSEGPPQQDARKSASVSYQRLVSPPRTASPTCSGSGSPNHQRTGSSPATLENGSANRVEGGKPGTVLPNPTRTSLVSVTHSRNLPTSGTAPGQRIKDPDTNQDIIFF